MYIDTEVGRKRLLFRSGQVLLSKTNLGLEGREGGRKEGRKEGREGGRKEGRNEGKKEEKKHLFSQAEFQN